MCAKGWNGRLHWPGLVVCSLLLISSCAALSFYTDVFTCVCLFSSSLFVIVGLYYWFRRPPPPRRPRPHIIIMEEARPTEQCLCERYSDPRDFLEVNHSCPRCFSTAYHPQTIQPPPPYPQDPPPPYNQHI